jgi:hypothetical protein
MQLHWGDIRKCSCIPKIGDFWLWAAENAKQTSQAQPFVPNNHVMEQIMARNYPKSSIWSRHPDSPSLQCYNTMDVSTGSIRPPLQPTNLRIIYSLNGIELNQGMNYSLLYEH